MNERIYDLANEANKDVGYAFPLENAKKLHELMEKFAELIVQECAIVIQKEVSMKYKDGGESEEFMGGHYAGSLLARVMIKKHFGVEK